MLEGRPVAHIEYQPRHWFTLFTKTENLFVKYSDFLWDLIAGSILIVCEMLHWNLTALQASYANGARIIC